MKTLILDLDDTLVDLQGALFDLMGVDRSRISQLTDYKSERGAHPGSLMGMSGMSKEEIYKRWESAGSEFWANLEWREGGKRIWEKANEVCDNVVIITALPRVSEKLIQNTIAGKVAWAARNLGLENEQLTISDCKQVFAGPDVVLVDDQDPYILSFAARGGTPIQVSQPWNKSSLDTEDVLGLLDIFFTY